MGTCTSSKSGDGSSYTMLDPKDQQPSKELLDDPQTDQQPSKELLDDLQKDQQPSKELLDDLQKDQQPSKELLDDLQDVCKKHDNAVKGFDEATKVHQSLVDELIKVKFPGDEGATENSTQQFDDESDILERLQNSLYSQNSTLSDTAMELFDYINIILRYLPVESSHFDILSKIIDDAPTRRENEQTRCASMQVEKQNEVLQKEMEATKQSIRQKDMELFELKNERKTLRDEIDKLKKYPKTLTPKGFSTPVQVFHSHSGDTIKDIAQKLKDRLKGANIHFIDRHQHTDIDTSQKLIVLRIIISRIGTDANSAIKNIKNLADTALVLIHEKDRFALTEQKSIGILTDKKFKALAGIFDLGFVNGQGYYHCKMNEDSLKGICSFVNKLITPL